MFEKVHDILNSNGLRIILFMSKSILSGLVKI